MGIEEGNQIHQENPSSPEQAHKAALHFLEQLVSVEPQDQEAIFKSFLSYAAHTEWGASVFQEFIQTNQQQVDMQTDLRPDPVDPQKVEEAFSNIITEQGERAKRTPVWYERIWAAFRGRENTTLTFEEISKEFSSSKTALNALYQTKKVLEPYGLEIEHVSSYRIRRKKITK